MWFGTDRNLKMIVNYEHIVSVKCKRLTSGEYVIEAKTINGDTLTLSKGTEDVCEKNMKLLFSRLCPITDD